MANKSVTPTKADNHLQQSTSGEQSPVINTNGPVEVKYGLDEDKIKVMLDQHEQNICQRIQEASGDTNRLFLLEQDLRAVQAQKADLKKSLEEEIQHRKAANEALGELKGQLLDEQIKQAKASLEQGDTKAAEDAFDAVVDKEGEKVALAAFQSGRLAEGRLDYTKAMRQYKKAVVLEENNPDYLQTAGKMARTMADYPQAEEWLGQLLTIREIAGENGLALASAEHERADLYYFKGNYDQAEPLYKHSLEIKEKFLGLKHLSVAATLNNLAELYKTTGAYDKSESLHGQALSIREKILGHDHPDIAQSLNNLAGLYEDQGLYEKAEPLYKRDLEISEKSLGKEHPDVAITLNNLGELYRCQGRYREAVPLYQRSLKIRRDAFGERHPAVGQTMNNLALVYAAQEDYAAAEPLYQDSLEIRKKTLGEEHPDVGQSLDNIGALYESQGRYQEAEGVYQRSLEITEKSLGKEHPDVATTLNNLAFLFGLQNRYKEAFSLYKRSLTIMKQVFPNGHPNIDIIQGNYDALKQNMRGNK